jgi:uncharacterized protein (TIGR02757 family)
MNTSRKSLFGTFSSFKHRFTTGQELASMLWGIRCAIERYSSLYHCFMDSLSDDDDTTLRALSAFVDEIRSGMVEGQNSLLPCPDRGSACKRLNLFLRWMVRRDRVDPGGWNRVSASKLIVPLDTHMFRICRLLHLTDRRQADMSTAIEVTYAFRRFAPEDPVRYDFALTRLGIRNDTELTESLISRLRSSLK